MKSNLIFSFCTNFHLRTYFIKYIQLIWKEWSMNDQILPNSFSMLFRIKFPVRHMCHVFPQQRFPVHFYWNSVERWRTDGKHRRTPSTSELRCQWKPESAKGSNTHIFQSELEQWVDGFHRATIFHVDFQFQISVEMTLTWPHISWTHLASSAASPANPRLFFLCFLK